jgi:hypothetical protein
MAMGHQRRPAALLAHDGLGRDIRRCIVVALCTGDLRFGPVAELVEVDHVNLGIQCGGLATTCGPVEQQFLSTTIYENPRKRETRRVYEPPMKEVSFEDIFRRVRPTRAAYGDGGVRPPDAPQKLPP